MSLVGTARFTWNSGANTFDPQMPLQAKRPLLAPRVKQKESRDGTVVYRVRPGDGVYDAMITLKYEPRSTALMAFLKAAIMDHEIIKYLPQAAYSSRYDNFVVVAPLDLDTIRFAADYPYYLEFDFEMRIRKTDGNDWDYLFEVES